MKKIIFLTCINYSIFSFGLTSKEYCYESKENSCVTKFGTVLGSNEGIPAFSNCRSECVNPIENKVTNSVISGVSWQCVEYARRWWLTKFGVNFGSVDTADQIFFLKEAMKLKDKKMIPLKSSVNNSSLPPKYGDLIVYKKQLNNKNFQYGHVAVVVDVNLKEHFIEVAEQNYNNKPWKDVNKYSRKISLKLKDGLYFLEDEVNNPILGWISLDLPKL